MKQYRTTININGDDKVFKYVIEAIKSENYWVNDNQEFSYTNNGNKIHILNDDIKYVKYSSYWCKSDEHISDFGVKYECIPNKVKSMDIRVYLPLFSPDIYVNTKYMITLNTWLNGHYIDLGSFLLNSVNALALPKSEKINDQQYYEYYEFKIIDPEELLIGDSWKNFRNVVCNNTQLYSELIGDESILNITLHPIESNDSYYIQNRYYHGGQNSINLSADADI